MTYTKPLDVTYTQMAIWIDEHVYSDDVDEALLYEYLYHLSNMLASQASYFSTALEYDHFALYSASRLFQRLYNPKQFEVDDHCQPKMKQIKSILNYIKKVIYPYKVDFEMEFRIENKHLDVIQAGSFDLGSHMIETASLFDRLEFSVSLDSVSAIVRSHLQRIPKRKNSSEWTNIYLSCMLTLLDSITLTRSMLSRYDALKLKKEEYLDRVYKELRYQKPILYHLPSSMSNYIRVLVNELRHVLASELSWKNDCYIPADASMKSLICTSLELEGK